MTSLHWRATYTEKRRSNGQFEQSYSVSVSTNAPEPYDTQLVDNASIAAAGVLKHDRSMNALVHAHPAVGALLAEEALPQLGYRKRNRLLDW